MHDLEVRDNSIETETKFLVVATSVPQMGKGLRYRRGKQLESPSIVPQYRHWKHFVPWKIQIPESWCRVRVPTWNLHRTSNEGTHTIFPMTPELRLLWLVITLISKRLSEFILV